jgi:hypothetical protein
MPQIKLILNLPYRNSPLSLILGELAHRLEGVRIIPIGNFDELKNAIFRNPDSRNLVVLSVESEADLNGLFYIEAFLQGTDLILAMPGDRPGLRSRARRLRPRYITTLPDELNDLPLILEAAVRKMEP